MARKPQNEASPENEQDTETDQRVASDTDPRADREFPPDASGATNLSPEDRFLRMERLMMQYFGTHHFAPPALAFNENAERDAARARFQRDMEEIEAKARAGNTGVPAATITQPH